MAMEEETDRLDPSDLLDSDDSEKETTESLDLSKEVASETNIEISFSSDDVQNFINPDLFEKARGLREQWNVVDDRLKKIEANRGNVKESVYQKVSSDYGKRLEETRQSFLAIKADVDSELASLRQKEDEVTRNIMAHEDTLEEAKFRQDLGEYTDGEYESIATSENEILETARHEQAAIQEAIQHYDDIFAGITLQKPEPEPVVPDEVTSSRAMPEPAPIEETPSVAPPVSAQESASPASPAAQQPAEAETAGEDEGPAAPPPPNVGATKPRAVSRRGEEAPKAKPAPTPEKEPETIAEEKAQLLLYENGQAVGQFAMNDEMSIGRSPSNEVVLKEPRISRRHAIIRKTGSQYMIIDNHSSNGTYVNGHQVTEQVLRSGDKVQVGSFELVFTV